MYKKAIKSKGEQRIGKEKEEGKFIKRKVVQRIGRGRRELYVF